MVHHIVSAVKVVTVWFIISFQLRRWSLCSSSYSFSCEGGHCVVHHIVSAVKVVTV